MSTHFQTRGIASSHVSQVHSVKDFAARHGLDEKQKRDLVTLFGDFATLHELLANCRMPRVDR